MQLASPSDAGYIPRVRILPMSTYRRNVLVGIVMLSALGMLGWMILRFGGKIAQPFAPAMTKVRFLADRADGVSDGSGVYFLGVNVGRVVTVTLGDNLEDIWFDAEVEASRALPAGMTARIRQASLLGSGSRIELIAPATSQPARLKAGEIIKTEFVGLEFFPKEIKELSIEVAAAAKQFREANVVGNLNKRLAEVGEVLGETRKTLESANKIVADDKVRADILTAIENIKTSSENVKSVTERADKIAGAMERAVGNVEKTSETAHIELTEVAKITKTRLEEVSKVVQQANEIAAKINTGPGTASQLVNDPKLYQGLVDTTTELNLTIKDLKRLIQQWEQEGVSLKLQ